MPEEKVRTFQQANCPECKKRITVEVLGFPPAADAGPRQQCKFTVGVCDNPIHRFDPEVQTKHIKLDNCVNWVAIRPVPQEAAPRIRHSDGIEGECLGCEDCNPKSAPARKLALSEIPGSLLNDGITEVEVAANRAGLSDASGLAERKIRQRFGKHGDLARIDDILAALIREAGSEREREFTRRLQISLADIDTLLGIAGSTVNSTVLAMIKLSQAEASRLLGGESK